MKSSSGAANAAVLLLALAFLAVPLAHGLMAHSPRLVVIGDLHGDYQHAKLLLRLTELINAEGDWVGGNTTLVQLGDLVDRGPEDKQVLDLFMNITKAAEAAGGRVVVILGNHEVMNLAGQLYYVPEQSYEAYGGKHKRKHAFSSKGVYGTYLRSLPLTYTAMGTVFVHGGLMPSHAKEGLESLNQQAADALRTEWWQSPLFTAQGPVWTRTQAVNAAAGDCRSVEKALELLSLDRMVVGHTPQRAGTVGWFCDGKLLAVDTGISRWMFGKPTALEFTQSGDGPVQIHEITPKVHRAHASEPASETAEPAEMADALKQDPTALQEMMEALREAEQRQEEPHEEL